MRNKNYAPSEYFTSGTVGSVSNEQQEDDSIYFEKNLPTEGLVKKIGDSARKIGQEKKLYASVTIAQAFWNLVVVHALFYNLFGIKGSHKEKNIELGTQEDNGDHYMTLFPDFECMKILKQVLKTIRNF